MLFIDSHSAVAFIGPISAVIFSSCSELVSVELFGRAVVYFFYNIG